MKSATYLIGNYYPQILHKLQNIKEENEVIGLAYVYYEEEHLTRLFMEQDGIHPKGISSWKRGHILNYEKKVIDFITLDAAQVIKDENIKGIYIAGEFLLRDDNAERLHKSLENIGYEAYSDYVEDNFYNILESSIRDSQNLPEVLDNWEAFNKQYWRPEEDYFTPEAIVVALDHCLFEPNDRYNYFEGTFNPIVTSMIQMLSDTYRIIFICDRPKSKADETIQQIQSNLNFSPDLLGKRFFYYFSYNSGKTLPDYRHILFRERLQYSFRIQYVLESDPNSLIFWRKMGFRTMFFGNPWKLTKEEEIK